MTHTSEPGADPGGDAGVTRPVPPVSDAGRPFWDATRERRLVLQWCVDCDEPVFFPREACPRCLGANLTWRPASGRGTVYAVTVEHRPQNPALAAMAPYAVALVELEEGARLLTNLVGAPPESFQIDDPVRVTWERLPDGRHLPQFGPA